MTSPGGAVRSMISFSLSSGSDFRAILSSFVPSRLATERDPIGSEGASRRASLALAGGGFLPAHDLFDLVRMQASAGAFFMFGTDLCKAFIE